MLSRLLALVAALVLASASTSASAYAQPILHQSDLASPPKTAPRAISLAAQSVIREKSLLSDCGVKENWHPPLKLATGHRVYANNNPYKFTDPDGRQACVGKSCPIVGKAQSTGTAGHAAAGDADAARMAASGEYKSVHLDQKLSTITGDPAAGQQRPDVAGVRLDTDGVDTVEHNSKSQSVASQDAKGQGMQQKLAAIGKGGSHQTRTITTALKGLSGKLGAAGAVLTVGIGAAELAQDPSSENVNAVTGDVVTGVLCGAMGGCGNAQ